jgi:3-hydroxyisobutyrate dehydrogenase-like beta-hydroxyacid dehydrogenase
MPARNTPAFAFIGFGEAGQALAEGLRGEGVTRIAAWDILFAVSAGAPLRKAGDVLGVRLAASGADAIRGTDVVVCAVTAASSLEAAQEALPHLAGQFFLDINSVSPGRKRETAALVDGAARYVDAAVMAPVHPARHQTPMLLSGPAAPALVPLLGELGMQVSVAGDAVGAAAAIKMMRSVMIKGLEALTLECFLAASRAGVEDQVIASLSKSFPALDWRKIIDYNLERMASHGERRAAEMEEVADTLRELGVAPLLTEATVARQREMGRLGKAAPVKDAVAQSAPAALRVISDAMRREK